MGSLLAQTPLIVLVGLIGWRNSFLDMGIITLINAITINKAKDSSEIEGEVL